MSRKTEGNYNYENQLIIKADTPEKLNEIINQLNGKSQKINQFEIIKNSQFLDQMICFLKTRSYLSSHDVKDDTLQVITLLENLRKKNDQILNRGINNEFLNNIISYPAFADSLNQTEILLKIGSINIVLNAVKKHGDYMEFDFDDFLNRRMLFWKHRNWAVESDVKWMFNNPEYSCNPISDKEVSYYFYTSDETPYLAIRYLANCFPESKFSLYFINPEMSKRCYGKMVYMDNKVLDAKRCDFEQIHEVPISVLEKFHLVNIRP